MPFPNPSTLEIFALAAIALLVIPGPAVLYVVTQSAEQGRIAGLASVAGIHVGTLVHLTAAALGLSAIVVASAVAFSVVKFAGAAYLIYIGIRRLLDRSPAEEVEPRALAASRRRLAAERPLRHFWCIPRPSNLSPSLPENYRPTAHAH